MSADVDVDLALAEDGSLRGLSARESDLVRKAGERVFELSRRIAEREREIDRLRLELSHVRALLEERSRSRDILSNQVMALQREADRSFEERTELRELLTRSQAQAQELLRTILAAPSKETRPQSPSERLLASRSAPQRTSQPRMRQATDAASKIRNWLANR